MEILSGNNMDPRLILLPRILSVLCALLTDQRRTLGDVGETREDLDCLVLYFEMY